VYGRSRRTVQTPTALPPLKSFWVRALMNRRSMARRSSIANMTSEPHCAAIVDCAHPLSVPGRTQVDQCVLFAARSTPGPPRLGLSKCSLQSTKAVGESLAPSCPPQPNSHCLGTGAVRVLQNVSQALQRRTDVGDAVPRPLDDPQGEPVPFEMHRRAGNRLGAGATQSPEPDTRPVRYAAMDHADDVGVQRLRNDQTIQLAKGLDSGHDGRQTLLALKIRQTNQECFRFCDIVCKRNFFGVY